MNPTMNNSGSSESVIEMVKGSHEFKVKGYSLVKGIGVGKFIASETFNVGGYEWAIYFYPDGIDTQENAGVYVSVFVVLVSNANDVRAKFELVMHDQSGDDEHFVLGHFNGTLGTDPYTLSTGEMWGIRRFYKSFHLEHSTYLIDDCLQVNCTVGVLPTTLDNSMIIEVPESSIAVHFGMLFEDEQSSDVTFCVGGNKFYAHKIVLAARSKDEELHFSVPSTMTSLSKLYVTKLLAAAHKYQLPRLKLMCESVLCKHISINSVAQILIISDCYDAIQLKSICLRFSTENLEAVLKSHGFKHLKKKCPLLQYELLKTVAKEIECVKSSHVDSDETHEPNEIEAESTSYNPSSDEENHLGW
ncbi:hypothetical protein ACSQ67_024454 [Phaseolus vulgaris]